MRIGIIGAGNIGANAARLWVRAGHQVAVGFSRDRTALNALATEIGATAGTAAQVVEGAEVVMISVPWAVVDQALAAVGGPGRPGRADRHRHHQPVRQGRRPVRRAGPRR